MLCFVVNDPLLEQKIVPLAIVVVSSFKNSLMPKKPKLIHTKIVLQFLQATHLSGENLNRFAVYQPLTPPYGVNG